MAKRKPHDGPELIRTWTIPTAATLGSSLRAKGILLEIRARLPLALRKRLEVVDGVITLATPDTDKTGFRSAAAIVSSAMEDIQSLPVIPREIQDILTISTTERHRWLKDGRLPSAGTRTVKLRGRARQITFHVFDPDLVRDLLDRDVVSEWREQDVIAAAEIRQRAAWKARATRAAKKAPKKSDDTGLAAWEEFARDGFLR
jgi:hypothetical protein